MEANGADEELLALASRFLDGTGTEADLERLAAMVREDANARRELARLMHQHGALRMILSGRRAAVDAIVAETAREVTASERPGRRRAASLRYERSFWGPTLGAAAAVLALTAGLFFYLNRREAREAAQEPPKALGSDPGPAVPGPAKAPGRGDRIETASGPRSLNLGGYCRLEVKAGSALRIAGQEGAEEIFLERGEVSCAVERAKGSFAVRTSLGALEVTGTRFDVRIQPESEELVVNVAEGAVRLETKWGKLPVLAGQISGVSCGVVRANDRRILDLDLPVKDGSRRFGPYGFKAVNDDERRLVTPAREKVEKIKPGERVAIVWKDQESLARIAYVEVLAPEIKP